MEINEYVRTIDGIKKINHSVTKNIGLIFIDGLPIQESDVLKSSFNLIDLIEVGDYVNGSKVIDIRTDEELEIGVESDNLIYHYIQNKDIKSILTHEQFEANAYKIEKER